MSLVSYIRNFFVVAGEEAVTRIAEWVKEKFYTKSEVYTKEEIDAMLSAGVTYLVVDSLPSTGVNGTIYLVPKQDAETGDVYDEYIWLPARGLVPAHFEHIGSTVVDLSNYYTKTEADDLLDDKVDKVNGKGLSTEDYTTAEKNKLSGIENGAEVNVQSDWNQSNTSADDFIKNKPSIYTKSETDTLLNDKVDKVTGKGLSTEDYTTAEKTKLANIEAGAEVNVQSDWNQSDSTADDFIKNKPTLRQPATDGTAGQYLKSNGSGNAPSWETMDSAPTANSTKAVTSGGVYTALDGKQASISITTKTDDAGDNDKVILQDNGVTNTTTFVRRSLTNIREWLLKKLIPEELLKWGGLNGQGERTALGVIDSTLINNIRANRVAWLTADHFSVEYSRDGGTTWQASRHIDDIMNWTSSPNGTNIYIGDADAEHIATSAYMTRITLTTAPSPASSNNYTFYCKIVKMCFYVATMGSTGCKLNVYLRTQANVESNTDTWVHIAEDCTLTGWSGWNIINFPSGIMTYGNNKSAQYGQIRMVFSVDGYSGNGTTNYGLSLQRLRVYAPDCWGVSNSLANYDSPFAFYSDKHVVFPSTVTATQLIRSGGTNSQLLVADGSVISMPIAVANGGTGATTAFKAEYNINTNVRNNHLTGDISDTSRIAFCSTSPSTTNGVFAGYRTMSQVWTWIKTHFDSSPTSGSANGITSGGVYSALEEKVNLQPDFTASQIDYSASNVGKWQKVLRFPEGADLVINMKKTAMGSDTTSTLWFSSSSMGDSYTSLFGNHSVRFVHDGGYVFLVLACRKSTNEPIETYTFQIAHSSVPMSDIVAVTNSSPITATPKEPNIVYRAPMTTGAVSFNVNSSGAGSVSMANHNDFLGNMTSEASNGVVVTMSSATEGQIYRFVFTRNITGGVTFKQSNVAYCTIANDVNAGDTITLTAVSNTADGWLYEQESAGIESSDGSNIVEYNGSTADVRVNWAKLPRRVVLNNYDNTNADPHQQLALGDGAQVDSSYTSNAIAIGKDSTARYSKALAVGCNASSSSSNAIAIGSRADSSAQYSIAIGSLSSASDSWAIAVGNSAIASNQSSIAIGVLAQSRKYKSIAIGISSHSEGSGSIAIGGSTDAYCDECITIGSNAKANANNGGIAIGYYADARGYDSIAMGDNSKADGESAISLGRYSSSSAPQSIALGQNAGVCERVLVNNTYKYCRMKPFNLLKFSVNGTDKFFNRGTGQVTITYEGNNYIINVANNTLFLTSDTEAGNIYSFVSGIFIDSTYYNSLNGVSTVTINVYPLYEGSNVYVVDCGMGLANTDTSTATSVYFYATYLVSSVSGLRGDAIGKEAKSYSGLAFGEGIISMVGNQTILGTYNVPSSTDYFQVGIGSTYVTRRNVLTIDGNERLKVCSYVGGTQTINMSQQMGSISNITKSVYKIKWNGVGTIRLTLGTDGCVEGQRVSIVAVTNDVQIFATAILIPLGTFGDFLFIDGEWIPSSGIWNV